MAYVLLQSSDHMALEPTVYRSRMADVLCDLVKLHGRIALCATTNCMAAAVLHVLCVIVNCMAVALLPAVQPNRMAYALCNTIKCMALLPVAQANSMAI